MCGAGPYQHESTRWKYASDPEHHPTWHQSRTSWSIVDFDGGSGLGHVRKGRTLDRAIGGPRCALDSSSPFEEL